MKTFLTVIIILFLALQVQANDREPEIQKLWQQINNDRLRYEAVRNRMIKFMFTVSELTYEDEATLVMRIKTAQKNVMSKGVKELAEQRSIMVQLHADTRRLDIYQLTDGILGVAKGDWEITCKLTALAWQETHFVNRKGRDGEIGFFQFLPSTIQEVLKLSDKDLKTVVIELDNNQYKAASFAWLLLKGVDIKQGIAAYNHGAQYPGVYFRKLEKVRTELL